MFESDDFDQILSQFDLPDVSTKHSDDFIKDVGNEVKSKPTKQHCPLTSTSPITINCNVTSPPMPPPKIIQRKTETCIIETRQNIMNTENISPKHTKRKMINSYFDHNAKRKFPGPAGLLNGNFEESKDETICHMELFSQDVQSPSDISERPKCSQISEHVSIVEALETCSDICEHFGRSNISDGDCTLAYFDKLHAIYDVDLSDNYFGEKFDTEIWRRLTEDVPNYNLGSIDSIKSVKQQALAGHLWRRKAQAVTGFVETIDRSATDPLITLRDTTGCIKCTLHRDAWSTFAPYIVSEYCALVLRRPTVLTTGSAFKKHYLNITLSNIHAIYSSAVFREDADSKPLPDGFSLECDNNVTLIRTVQNINSDKEPFCHETSNDTSDLLDDLDNIFTDDLF